MNITYSIKQLGKKHPVVGYKSIDIEDIGNSTSLRSLVSAVVKQQVDAYNAKETEKSLIDYLMPPQIEDLAVSGKVGFGVIHNDNKAITDKAIAVALQAFDDGIYCVFIDDKKIESLNDIITIKSESVFSFIRLCFLAGSYW